MNKNNVIFILFVAALLGSTWGAIVNRQKIDLVQQLKEAQAELRRNSGKTGKAQVQAVAKTAGAQDLPVADEARAGRMQKELEALRKEFQAVTAKLSGCNAALLEQSKARDVLVQQLRSVEAGVAAGRDAVDEESAAQAARRGGPSAEPVGDELQQPLARARAQVLGLEKIIEEKDMALQQAAREKERLQINMDVLLAKIAEQQNELQAQEEINRDLAQQLAAAREP